MKPKAYVIAIIASTALSFITANAALATEKTMTTTDKHQTNMTGDQFLTKNTKKAGVVTLPDGLQYKILTQGKGEKPTINDTVTVHYEGKLVNGTVFDSSYKRGEPASFPVNAVIPGWTEALQLMTPGSTWELYIPSKLAYGEQGAPPQIGPNETLIFKVNLISVNKA